MPKLTQELLIERMREHQRSARLERVFPEKRIIEETKAAVYGELYQEMFSSHKLQAVKDQSQEPVAIEASTQAIADAHRAYVIFYQEVGAILTDTELDDFQRVASLIEAHERLLGL